jgi:hypothetical protein
MEVHDMVRTARLLILLIVLAAPATAQKKYLVTPDREVVPLRPGDDVRKIIAAMSRPDTNNAAYDCGWGGWGYPAWVYWTDVLFNARHKDVIAQWFVTPAAGTIDSVYWINGEIGNWLSDSMAFLRIHRSTIGPGYGPGVRPGPFSPPCQPWGYWINTNDIEMGVAAFPQEATDTTWISTIPNSSVPSSPPVGEELWGSGGFGVKLAPNSVNSVAMADLSTLNVDRGDRLFVSLRLSVNPVYLISHVEPPEEVPTQFAATTQSAFERGGEYPSRDWKFYEHPGTSGNGPSNCGAYDPDTLPRGWYARGGLSADSTDIMAFNIWYTMTVTGNAPPQVDAWGPSNTFSTGDQPVSALIWDCYSVTPGYNQVGSAFIRYTVDGVEQTPVPMVNASGDWWDGTIPGQPTGSLVSYMVGAVDWEGDTGTGPPMSYRVLPFGNEWYSIDTGYVCTDHDIRSSGTTVDPSGFFLPPGAPGSASAGDDGTSGPHDLGADFYLFGDWFRYAWIGVNGGIALTKSATDTQDVNAGGIWQTMPYYYWGFPNPQKHGRADTAGSLRMPGMFIAPLWANHILMDSSTGYGRIVTGNDGDSCLFIVEWDSIGNNQTGTPGMDGTTFRLVLDRCSGPVEFQYGKVNGHANGYGKLSGMQADSNATSGSEPGYLFLSQYGQPPETAPSDGRCIRMYPTVGFIAHDGWNLVSVSSDPVDGDYSVHGLFPELVGRVWGFDNGFIPLDTLPPGVGFWMKSTVAGRVGHSASTFRLCSTVPVRDKWNLVGTPSCFDPVGSIIPAGGVITSSFYGYGISGYYTAGTLQPGRAYWVKMDGAGSLQMCCGGFPAASPLASASGSAIEGASSLTIRDAAGRSQTLYLAAASPTGEGAADPGLFELPPPPPDGAFDVRYASGRMLERFTAGEDAAARQDFPIAIRDATFPLTVEWTMTELPGGPVRIALSGDGDGKGNDVPVTGNGSTVIAALPSGFLTLSVVHSGDIPAEFALGPNYPNPFNPSTTFVVDLPEAADVRLEVVDILGRSVATLLNGRKPAGSYTVSWDGLDRAGVRVPTGVYIVRMAAGNYSAARKIMFMK